jgi:hypothetical protein
MHMWWRQRKRERERERKRERERERSGTECGWRRCTCSWYQLSRPA